MKILKKLRGKHGLTQTELAEILGVARPYVSMLEQDGIDDLSPTLTRKVCEYFQITPCELYGINNLKYRPKDREELERFIEVIRKDFE